MSQEATPTQPLPDDVDAEIPAPKRTSKPVRTSSAAAGRKRPGTPTPDSAKQSRGPDTPPTPVEESSSTSGSDSDDESDSYLYMMRESICKDCIPKLPDAILARHLYGCPVCRKQRKGSLVWHAKTEFVE